MHHFSISRLPTSHGIFQLIGRYNQHEITIEIVKIMSTDGWVALDLKKEAVKSALTAITKDLQTHLATCPTAAINNSARDLLAAITKIQREA